MQQEHIETSTDIDSFVIRFIRPVSSDNEAVPVYRGTIRHVQSNQEQAFKQWQEVELFIQRFVTLAPDPGDSE